MAHGIPYILNRNRDKYYFNFNNRYVFRPIVIISVGTESTLPVFGSSFFLLANAALENVKESDGWGKVFIFEIEIFPRVRAGVAARKLYRHV